MKAQIFIIVMFYLALAYVLGRSATPPGIFASKLILSSATCDISGEGKVYNCKIVKGKTLDDAMQEWYDLYMKSDE